MKPLTTSWRWLKRLICEHECRIGDIQRSNPWLVTCRCRKCGGLLKATYGLALRARLVR